MRGKGTAGAALQTPQSGAADQRSNGPKEKDGKFPIRGRMRQLFSRRQKAGAIDLVTERNPPEPSGAATSTSPKTFPSGIKPFYTPANAIVEYVKICSKL